MDGRSRRLVSDLITYCTNQILEHNFSLNALKVDIFTFTGSVEEVVEKSKPLKFFSKLDWDREVQVPQGLLPLFEIFLDSFGIVLEHLFIANLRKLRNHVFCVKVNFYFVTLSELFFDVIC